MKLFCANSSISMHFSSVQPILSCESRHIKISLETIVNSFKILFETSLPRVVGHIHALSVRRIMGYDVLLLCFSVTVNERPRSRPFLMTIRCSALSRASRSSIGEDVGWIHFLSRDVQIVQSILSIALSVLFRMTRIAPHCPRHESSSFDFSLNGLKALLCCRSA